MSILSLKAFLKEYNLEDDTMNESELQKVYNFNIYPRDSIITADRGFVNTDNGSLGGTHWTCFYVKDKKSFYFESFVGYLDKFLLQQLSKRITFHKFKVQDIYSRLCDGNCLYFFHLIERMDYHNVVLRIYLDKLNDDKCIW